MSAQELKSLATAGRLHPEDLVRHGREAAWVPAGRLKGLFSGSAAHVGSKPAATDSPPGQTAGSLRKASPPADTSRPPGAAPPLAFDRGGHALPPLPQSAVGDATTASQPKTPAVFGGPPAGQVSAEEKPPQAMGGLEFLEQEYSAPAGFKAPRPKSSISDVLEQKRQRERRNLTILAGVAVGLMLVLGVLMTILFLKQHAAVQESVSPGSSSPGGGPSDKLTRMETPDSQPPGPKAAASPKDAASRSAFAAPPDKAVAAKPRPAPEHGSAAPVSPGASQQASASKVRLAERSSESDRPPGKDQFPASAKARRKQSPRPKSVAGGVELPPPTGDPAKDLGIDADMAPVDQSTPWSALPDPPRKQSAENGEKEAAP